MKGVRVPISSVLDVDAKMVIGDFEKRLLVDDEFGAQARAKEHGAYMDTEMRRDTSLYLRFLACLAERGLLAGARRRRGRLTPFCVRNMRGGEQRLVFDCLKVNCWFKHAPVREIASAEVFSAIHVEGGQLLQVASADIQACFYQCGVDDDLAASFAMRAILGSDACVCSTTNPPPPSTTR